MLSVEIIDTILLKLQLMAECPSDYTEMLPGREHHYHV